MWQNRARARAQHLGTRYKLRGNRNRRMPTFTTALPGTPTPVLTLSAFDPRLEVMPILYQIRCNHSRLRRRGVSGAYVANRSIVPVLECILSSLRDLTPVPVGNLSAFSAPLQALLEKGDSFV